MTDIIHAFLVLHQIRDQLSGSNGVAAALASLTGSSQFTGSIVVPELELPKDYVLSPDTDDKAELPHVAVFQGSDASETDWMTPHRQTTIPLTVEIRYRHDKADRETAYMYGFLYNRAVDMALKATYENTDAYFINVLGSNVSVGTDSTRYKATATLNALVYVMTTRRDP
jgi:hypothetical protein